MQMLLYENFGSMLNRPACLPYEEHAAPEGYPLRLIKSLGAGLVYQKYY